MIGMINMVKMPNENKKWKKNITHTKHMNKQQIFKIYIPNM